MLKEVLRNLDQRQSRFHFWNLLRLLPVLVLPFMSTCARGELPNRIFAVTYLPDDYNKRALVVYDDNPITGEQSSIRTIYDGNTVGIIEVSPKGDSVLSIEWDGHDWEIIKVNAMIDASENTAVKLTDDDFDNPSASWSPDGSQIVYEVFDQIIGDSDLYLMDADGQNKRPLVESPRMDGIPHWSPDGTKIAYIVYDRGNRDAYVDLYILDLASRQTSTILTFSGVEEYIWSPDGNSIAYTGYDKSEKSGNIYMYDLATRESTNITNLPGNQWSIDWSLDGNQIVFSSDHLDGTADICLVRPDGENLHCITESETDILQPQFSLDGGHIYFTHSPYVYEEQFLYRVPVGGGEIESVSTGLLPDRVYTYEIGQFRIGEDGQGFYPRLIK